jgi:hypothetical protein
MPLSIFDEYQLVTATSSFFRMLSLDQVWTDGAERGAQGEDVVEALEPVVAELRDLVGRAGESAYAVVRAAQALDPGLSEIAHFLTSDDERAMLEALFGAAGGVIPFAQQTYESIVDMLPNERAELNNQWSTLQGGGAGVGDLSRKFMCKLADIMMVGGAVSTVVPPHLHGPATFASGLAIYRSHKCWELDPARPRPAGI